MVVTDPSYFPGLKPRGYGSGRLRAANRERPGQPKKRSGEKMTLFGFRLWKSEDEKRIEAATDRIAATFEGFAEDFEEARRRNRAAMGLDSGEPSPKALKGKGGRA